MLKSRFHKTFVKFQNRENFQQKYTWLWTDIKIDNLWSRAYFLLHSSTKLSFLSTLFITSLTFLSSHCTTSGCFQQAWHRPMYKPISCLRAAVWLKKPIKQSLQLPCVKKKISIFSNTLLRKNVGFQTSVCNPDKSQNMCNRKIKLLHDFCKIEMFNFKIKSTRFHNWISFDM